MSETAPRTDPQSTVPPDLTVEQRALLIDAVQGAASIGLHFPALCYAFGIPDTIGPSLDAARASQPITATDPRLEATKADLLAEVLRRCMGLDANDNARRDFGEINGGGLQRPSEVAAELLRALGDEGLTLAALPVREDEPTGIDAP